MKTPRAALIVALVLSLVASSRAERVLDRDEALEILKELTSQNRTTWISAGVIEATHESYRAPVTTDSDAIESQIQKEIQEFQANPSEILCSEKVQQMYLEAIPFNVQYRLANESTTTSDEVVKYDGQRFYWEIDIGSRNDSVSPTGDLTGNYMTDGFDLTWNERRIYAWDGVNYTIYSASARYATVDADSRFPRRVNGPLTAGFVAWGQGNLTYDSLSGAETSAIEVDRDGMTQIQLTVRNSDGTSSEFYLVPAMGYAVASCTLARSDNTITTIYYDGYEEVADSWVPGSVLVEKHDALSERLLSSDKWEIRVVESSVPKSDAFKVEYYDDTAVEYCSSVTEKNSRYRYSKGADTGAMLAEHLTYAARKGRQNQNCATAALKYAASQLGVSVSEARLETLVDAQGRTTLYDLKQCAESLGLHCQTFKTRLSALQDLSDCQILVAQPEKEHLVVVDRVDSAQTWVVDLTNENFYYRQDLSSVAEESTVMLLSRRPLLARAEIANDMLVTRTVGVAAYSCTELLQEELVVTCPDCIGMFYWYYERWGCEPAASGTCTWQWLARVAAVQCDLRPNNQCVPLGDWYYSYMYACL